jgi:hypothetical protein
MIPRNCKLIMCPINWSSETEMGETSGTPVTNSKNITNGTLQKVTNPIYTSADNIRNPEFSSGLDAIENQKYAKSNPIIAPMDRRCGNIQAYGLKKKE